MVPHETAAVSAQVLCTSYNHAPCHFMQSHICKVHVCLAVTCHLHFWQNDRDLLRATVVTQGWKGYRNKSAQKVDPSRTKTHKLLILSTCCCVEVSRFSQVAVTSPPAAAASASQPGTLLLVLVNGLALLEGLALEDWFGVLVRRLSASAMLTKVLSGVWVKSPTPWWTGAVKWAAPWWTGGVKRAAPWWTGEKLCTGLLEKKLPESRVCLGSECLN